jgi:hypothetical protein
MYVNVAVLKETARHERRVALVPSVTAGLVKLSAKLHMQSSTGDASSLCSSRKLARHPSPDGLGAVDLLRHSDDTKSSPIYGMPIHNADKAKKCYVVKREQGNGYLGIENELFYEDNTYMVYGDAQVVLVQMIEAVRGLGAAAA